jgi:metal-responsive CopG/Arc/MetJ family transcriptional regulator
MWDSLDRAPRSPGRPKIGQGAKNVLVSLELSLLERADNFAKQHGVGRSQLIAKAVERYLRDAIELETDLAKTAVA